MHPRRLGEPHPEVGGKIERIIPVNANAFQQGDAVVHPRRPEWGTGTVRSAESIVHDGRPAQRLTVDFTNRGRVVINTAVAPLSASTGHAKTMTQTASSASSNGKGWLEQLEAQANGKTHELWDLPDALSDPFSSDAQRLQATLEQYRFSTEARSIIEWAVQQTGLADPLTKYTRHDLEQAFPRFARDLDQHLKQLVRTFKHRNDQASLLRARNESRYPAAQKAIDKALRH